MADDYDNSGLSAGNDAKRWYEEECGFRTTKRQKIHDFRSEDELHSRYHMNNSEWQFRQERYNQTYPNEQYSVQTPFIEGTRAHPDNYGSFEKSLSPSHEEQRHIRYKFWIDQGYGEDRARVWSEYPLKDFLVYHELVAAGKIDPFIENTSRSNAALWCKGRMQDTVLHESSQQGPSTCQFFDDSTGSSRRFVAGQNDHSLIMHREDGKLMSEAFVPDDRKVAKIKDVDGFQESESKARSTGNWIKKEESRTLSKGKGVGRAMSDPVDKVHGPLIKGATQIKKGLSASSESTTGYLEAKFSEQDPGDTKVTTQRDANSDSGLETTSQGTVDGKKQQQGPNRRRRKRRLKKRQEARDARGAFIPEIAPTHKHNKDPEEMLQQRQRPFVGDTQRQIFNRNQLSLVIYRADGKTMTEEFATEVRKRVVAIVREGAQDGVGGKKLAFKASGLVAEGHFLVSAETTDAKEWLLSKNFGWHEGVQIKIRQYNIAKYAIWIPGKDEDQAPDPMKLLAAQNNHKTDLRVNEWLLIHKDKYPSGRRLVVGVPQAVAELDHQRGVIRLSYEATQVFAKPLRTRSQT